MHAVTLTLLPFLFQLTLTTVTALTASPTPPAELFSPLIPTKILSIASTPPSPLKYPQYTDTLNGDWIFFTPDTWTSGFFPVTLYELNTRKLLCGTANDVDIDKADWVSLGREWSVGEVVLETSTTVGHDVGFLSFPFVEELIVNPTNETAITAVNSFATELAARFNPTVGCTRSWDTSDPTDFTVIIDNMMNLEVLFQSYALTGNTTLRDIAISHADTTMVNHVREDGSTWHVIEYNSTTGAVIKKRTAQGYSDDSTWSRGQAWAIYGFANMHQNTNDTNYLDTSRRAATYFLNNLPSDGIVPWDFNAPLTPAPRPADSSAATIAATGLLLLSQREMVVGNETGAQLWSEVAVQILNNITTLAWNPSWQSLLSNGTVNWPANNSLTGIVYGDYYFIKAGNELVRMGLATCSENSTSTSTSTASGAAASTSSFSSQSGSTNGSNGSGRIMGTGPVLLLCVTSIAALLVQFGWTS